MNKYFTGPITGRGVEGTSRSDGGREGGEEGLTAFGMEGEPGVKDITN